MSDKLKQDLKAIADGQGLYQVPDPKQVAKEALERIESLDQEIILTKRELDRQTEKKPTIKKDTLITNE